MDRGDLPPFATRPDGAVRVDYQRRLDEVDDEPIGAAIVVADAIPPVVRAFLGAEPLCIPEARAMASDVADRCRRDALAIHELVRLDADIDGLRAHLVRDAADTLETSSELTLIGLLGRYFERIGDHGVMFAQHATFAVTGERVGLRS